jgi:hypothetical protein
VEHAWQTNVWISSGFDEPGAQMSRRETFVNALANGAPQSMQWLRNLHRSHSPSPGPYSTCMHRADARTVSYTEISVAASFADVRYCAGPPCCSATARNERLRLKQRF